MKRTVESPFFLEGTFHVVCPNGLIIRCLQTAAWPVSVHEHKTDPRCLKDASRVVTGNCGLWGKGSGAGHCQKREGAEALWRERSRAAGLRSLFDDVICGRQATDMRRSSTQSDRVSPFLGDCPAPPPFPQKIPCQVTHCNTVISRKSNAAKRHIWFLGRGCVSTG